MPDVHVTRSSRPSPRTEIARFPATFVFERDDRHNRAISWHEGDPRGSDVPKLEVFVSHRTVEAKFADALRTHLARDFIGIVNFFVSTDVRSVPAGSQWFDALVAGLQRAHLLLAICSNESVRLPWINYETGGACARNVEVIPLCHSGMIPEHLPVPLSMLEAVLLSDAKGLAKLYTRISSLIGSDVPDVNFQALSDEFRELEAEYSAQIRTEASASHQPNRDSIVQDPRVVCVSSQQYLQLGIANELQAVLDAFPKSLRHDVVTTSEKLTEILRSQVDVVHIAAYVCPRTGTLYFSRVELPLGNLADKNRGLCFGRCSRDAARARTHAARGHRQRRFLGVGDGATAPHQRDLPP